MIARLRGRSVAELTDRALHLVRTMADRRGLLRPALPAGVPVAPPRALLVPDPSAIAAVAGAERAALIARADAVLAHRFPLLGYDALDYGSPPDWQRDPVTGRRAALVHWSRVPYLDVHRVGDHKLTWEISRHQWLLWLAQAWLLTRDPRYADGAAGLVDRWIADNPPKLGMNWTSALELAFRTIAWTHALPLFADAPGFGADRLRRIAASLLAQVDHLEWNLSTWFSPNTHLTGEALALLVAGTAWPSLPGAARRRDLGWRILCEQALVQHRPDGTYFEQTSWYQAYTVDFFVHAIGIARAEGLPLPAPVAARIHAAARALRAVARHDGTIPLLGDDDGGHLLPLAAGDPADVSDVLARAALCFDDPALTVPGARGGETLRWTHGPGATARHEALASRAGPPGSALLRDGGWIVLRDGDDPARAHHLVFDAGPHGALSCGHAHADALAVVLTVGGRPIIVDPGTGAYVGERRDRYRATRAHATVTVDGRDSSEQGSAFRWRTATDARLVAAGLGDEAAWADAWHDGYARLADPVRHRRTIVRLARRYWIMLDTLTCAGTHDVALSWPLAPGAVVTADAGASHATVRCGDVAVTLAADPRLDLAVETRTVSPAYGREVAAPALVTTARIEGSTTLCTVIAAADECAAPALAAAGTRRWTIAHARGTDTLVVPAGEPVVEQGVEFEGAWLVHLGGRDDRVLLAGDGRGIADGVSFHLHGDEIAVLDRVGAGWRRRES